jgi:membrane protein YqaA with SNARE-associated domain
MFAPPAPAVHPHHSLIPKWLTQLGPLGLFAVAVVDSSPIPLPIPGSTDLLLLWLVSHNDGEPWILALCAVAGSILGGFTSWHIGRKGGEMALRKYVPARLHARVVSWVRQRPILAVFLPAVMPPPIPLSPFVLAAGALGVARKRFLLTFGAARTLRYGLIAWLGVTYGRGVVRLWSRELEEWSTPMLSVFFVVLAASLCFGVWKLRSRHKNDPAEEPVVEAVRAQAD